MTRIYRAHTLPESLPQRLADEGVGLATVDLDKVLAGYRQAEVYPDAPRFMDALRSHNITPVIATNSHNRARLDAVSRKLGGVTILCPQPATPGQKAMRSKPYPDMLLAAREQAGASGKAAHIDDQFKAYIAARSAGFDTFVWLKPRGGVFPDHPVTVALRPLELPVRGLLTLAGIIQQLT